MGFWLQRFSIRTQIFLLALAIVVPVAAMLVWILGANVRHARESAHDKVRILAASSATDVARHLHQAEATLSRLAARPKVKALDARQCDPVIGEFIRLNPELVTLSLRDREARVVCSFLSRAPGADRVARLPWFIEGLRSEKFSVSEGFKADNAFLGRASGRWLSVLTYPVRDDTGRVSGLLALTVDLLKLSGELFEAEPKNAIVAVLDKSNTIVLRSVDAGTLIGRSVEKAESGLREGSFANVAADGVKRQFSFVTIPGVEWRVVAGLPEAEVFAEYYATLRRSLAIGFGVLLFALVLAWRIGAAIVTPIARLAGTVTAVAAGDTAARAHVAGPAEIESVAQQFNRMLDARDQSERFLRGFVDRLPAMTSYWDKDLICRFANRAYIDWFGETPEQMVGRHLRDVVGEAGFAVVEGHARAALQGTEQRFERNLRMASGREGHALVHYVPDRVDGEVKGFFASAIDITESKRAVAATREAAQRLEIALEGSLISVWEADMRTDEVWLDAAWSAYLGGPAEPTHSTAATLLTRVHPDDRAGVVAAAVQTMRGEVSRYSLDHRVKAANGEWRWIQSSGRVIERDAAGRALRMSGTNTDITERRQAEAALQESEARYRTLIEWSPEAIHVHRDGRFIYVNPAAIKIYGAQCAEDIVGKPSIDLVHPDYREIALERTRRMVEDGVSAPMIEIKFIRLDGKVIDVESQGTPIIYDGKPAIHASVRDITERKRAEATLAAKTELLRDTFDNMTEGISVVGPGPGLRLEAWNRRFAELLGLPDSLLHGDTSFVDIIRYNAQRGEYGPGDIEEQVRGRVALATHIEPHRIERTRPDGTVLAIQGVPLPRGGFVTTYRDITDRKKSELALRIAATAFESQEGIVITDAANVILRVNQAFSEITGYSAEEVVGRNPRLLASGRHDLVFFAAMMESLHGEGRWKGEIWNRRKGGEVYPEMLTITAVRDDAGAVTHYVGTFTDISAHKTAEDQIKHLAFYDPLTGLPNRRLLMDRLGQTLAAGARHQRKGALLFVDLDNFKTINDTLGHYQGDMLLEQVARRLTSCIREGDTAARIGGDEFVVMLKDLSENVTDAVAQAETVGGKILAALSQTYPLAGQEYHVTSSVGVTLIGVDQQEGIDEPLKRADLAMYQAKAAGRNTLRFFDPQMQAVVTTRAAMEMGLREAVAAKQFVLHYQAQVLGEGRLIGAECLLRWRHPERGMVSPSEFIPLAEESGLILSLGQWVLESACTQLAEWAAGPETAHLTVAVNVSSRQFRHPDFVAQVLSVLERTGANPERLKLELTESLLVANIEDVIAKMNALKNKGVNFALDDFGTGYSSLSYLKRLPLDQLKIDQSFVRDLLIDPNDAVIARTVVALGHSLGLQVMAEGVETAVQHDFLVSIGCDAYQGYYFGRPVAAGELAAFAAPGLPV